MSDIQPGDVVVCVDASPPRFSAKTTLRLELGALYRVSEVWAYPGQSGPHVLVNGEPPHRVPGYTGPAGWTPSRFRKLLPDEPLAAEEEFTTLIRKMKPVKVPS